jgi:hypothetical protein
MSLEGWRSRFSSSDRQLRRREIGNGMGARFDAAQREALESEQNLRVLEELAKR